MTTRPSSEREDLNAVMVTGLSGAGKTTALNALADLGYYCVDNLPPTMAAAMMRVCQQAGIDRVALGMDVRVGSFLQTLDEAVEALKGRSEGLEVLYLDAADDALVRRFSETRRPHPIIATANSGGPIAIEEAVRLERERLSSIRSVATLVVDTSHLSVHGLRRQIVDRFGASAGLTMRLMFLSFGFKYGLPLDANLVFDVRFLDNPFFIPELRELTGNDPPVRDFVLSSRGAAGLLERLQELVSWSLPRYQSEGKSYLTVAIGCTGGRHRSVAITNEMAHRLARGSGERVGIAHRDVDRGVTMTREPASDQRRVRWSKPRGATGLASEEEGV